MDGATGGDGEARTAVRGLIALVMGAVVMGAVAWATWTTATLIEIRVAVAELRVTLAERTAADDRAAWQDSARAPRARADLPWRH